MKKTTISARHLRMMFNLTPIQLVIFVRTNLTEGKEYFHSFGNIYYRKSAIKKLSEYYNMPPLDIKFDEEIQRQKKDKKKKEINPLIKELIKCKKREKKIKTLKSLIQTPVTFRGFGRSNKNT